VALKSIGLGGLFKGASKKVDDIKVKLKGDADYSYEGPESGWEGGTWTNVSFEPLTKVGIKILDSLVKSKQMIKDKVGGYISNTSEDAAMAVEKIKNKNGKMQVETTVGEKTKGAVKGEYESTKIYSGKDIDSRKILHETSELATDSPYHDNVFHDEFTEDIINIISPKKVKKGEGGAVGLPPVQLGPLGLTPRASQGNDWGKTREEIIAEAGLDSGPSLLDFVKPRASGSFTEGQPYGPDTREKTWSDNVGISGMLDLPGGFSLTGEYDKYRTKDRLYTADDEYLDERVKDDHDRGRLELQWKKKFAKGGKAWQPKSAPKLTTTIPPERGPTPHGLTYLTGDDIVKHRIG
jgi:hypothetical protein